MGITKQRLHFLLNLFLYIRRVIIWQNRGQPTKNLYKRFLCFRCKSWVRRTPEKNKSKLTHGKVVNFRIFNTAMFRLQYLLWRHIVLLTVGVCSSNHRVLYTIEISMTRRFTKKCRSVRPSVRLSVRLFICSFSNAKKKPTPPSLLVVEK